VRPVTSFGVKGGSIATPWEYRGWGKNAKEAEAVAREMNLPEYQKAKKAKR
jgi:hypothetical protein